MAEENDALFREIDEEVRQDEYKRLWDKYGKYVTIAAFAFIGAIAAFQGWKYYEKTQAEEASVVYFEALKKSETGKPEDAIAALSAVNHVGFGTLAKLEKAAVLAKKGDVEGAVAAYDAFAADPSHDPALAELAKIKAAYALVDTKTPDELLSRIGAFDKEGAQWRNEAREIFALSAYRVKDYAMAERYFTAIAADAKASAGVKQRASLMLQLLKPLLDR